MLFSWKRGGLGVSKGRGEGGKEWRDKGGREGGGENGETEKRKGGGEMSKSQGPKGTKPSMNGCLFVTST